MNASNGENSADVGTYPEVSKGTALKLLVKILGCHKCDHEKIILGEKKRMKWSSGYLFPKEYA